LAPYEILLMLDPELPDERQSEIVSRTRELIERSGGTWDAHDVWGRRKLAYEIDHKTDGAYHLLTKCRACSRSPTGSCAIWPSVGASDVLAGR
jgi:ribosomal protein S6